VQLKNIGRVRARKLHDAGFTSRKGLKNAPFETVAALLGPAVTSDVFTQLGERRGVLDRKDQGDATFLTDE
jgi:helicase